MITALLCTIIIYISCLGVHEGAIIKSSPVPYQETSNVLVNNKSNPRAMKYNRSENPDEDDEESKSTTYGAVEKIDFKKTFCPVYHKKSFESDSVLGLTTESGTESLNCDSAIESEANNVADNIFQDNIVNEPDKENSETFLVSATSDQVVSLKDFAFENQENFFTIPDDLKIPLNIPKNQLLDIPIKQSFLGQSSKTFEDLSLIEEITEHSSLSTIKSREVTPRILSEALDQTHDNEEKAHKPRILQKTLSLDSPRVVSNNKITKICSEIDFKLPSKSNPATPREDQNDNDKNKKPKFAQNKPKVVSKRYQRSPPRDSPSYPKPIQTKTGLVVTQVERELEPVMGRSSSSASLILRSSPQPLDRLVSKSSENISAGQIPRYKRQKYDHVESKVKKYIEESQRNNSKQSKMQRKELSSSSSSLVKISSNDLPVPVLEVRPKTADATTHKLSRSSGGGLQKLKMKRLLSKSETNLKHCKVLSTPSLLSKSSFSIGHIGAIYDTSEEEDVTQLTAIYKDETLDTKAGSLLDLVAKERKSKQEAKKVITELQTSFDDLLQRYAAAENALDKVRFGIKPSEDGSRQETFTMAEKVAEKIASFEIKEKHERSVGTFEIRKTDKKIQIAREKIIGILNQVMTKLLKTVSSHDLNFWMSSIV